MQNNFSVGYSMMDLRKAHEVPQLQALGAQENGEARAVPTVRRRAIQGSGPEAGTLGADRTANILDGALEDIRLLKNGLVAVVWLGGDGVEITAEIDPVQKEVHWGIEANTSRELAVLAQELKAKKGVDLRLRGRKA